MAKASVGGVVVGGHGGVSHKDKEFLDEALNAPAELALDRQWVIKVRATAGQQFPFQPQLGKTPLPRPGMDEGLGLSEEVIDGRCPPGNVDSFVERPV